MISKNDLIYLLTELGDKNNIDVKSDIELVLKSNYIPIEILKKINNNRQLDLVAFYTKLRMSYNKKKSKLYINIMKADENLINDPKTVLTTLSALLNQILQFEVDDKIMFFEHSRANEIIKALDIYFRTFDINPAAKLLGAFKADIKVLEMIDK